MCLNSAIFPSSVCLLLLTNALAYSALIHCKDKPHNCTLYISHHITLSHIWFKPFLKLKSWLLLLSVAVHHFWSGCTCWSAQLACLFVSLSSVSNFVCEALLFLPPLLLFFLPHIASSHPGHTVMCHLILCSWGIGLCYTAHLIISPHHGTCDTLDSMVALFDWLIDIHKHNAFFFTCSRVNITRCKKMLMKIWPMSVSMASRNHCPSTLTVLQHRCQHRLHLHSHLRGPVLWLVRVDGWKIISVCCSASKTWAFSFVL